MKIITLARTAGVLAICVAFAAPAQSAPRLPRLALPGLGAAAQAKAPAPGAWAHAASDVAPDPSIRFGTLPNGMRYALARQAQPPGQAAIRFWFDAGSLMEGDDQQGLAHFLEHMAFNGSRAIPEGEMIKRLERLGLAFGADTNASTGFTQTIYKLDLPKTDDETIDTSLLVMRETASELLLEQGAVDRERGVVLSEERARDTPAFRTYRERLAFILKGQRPPERLPIGKVDVLKTAPAERLRAFYEAYYRPERAVLVAVGDFDPDVMETRIRQRFADWSAVGAAGAEPDLGKVAKRGTEARLTVEPGAAASLQLAWVSPHDARPDTLARRREDLARALGFSVLNRRLAALARSPDAPFLGAGAFRTDESKAADVTMLSVTLSGERWREGLEAAEQESRRALEHGVRQDELAREIEEFRASLKAAAAGAATRRPSAIAADILAALDDDEVVTNPVQDLAFFEENVAAMTPEVVGRALREVFRGEGPLVFATTPKPIAGGETTVLAALASSRKVEVSAPSAPRTVEWPYADFGPPGQIAGQQEVADLDAVVVRFANNVRLVVKPTRLRDDEVLVRVNVGQGLKGLPAGVQGPSWAAAAFVEGGLGKINADDLERVLAARVYGARFGVSDDALTLTGSTRTDHLDTQLQVLAAYVSDPGWRAEAFERVRKAGETAHDQFEATDFGVLSRDLAGLLHAGDRRWTFPTREEIRKAAPGDLRATLASDLASGPIEVVIVGDTTVEKATDLVARTFGALPARAPGVQGALGQVGFPAPGAEPVRLTHKGRKDQSIGYIAWRTSDFYASPQQARDNAVLGEVLELRLIDELREAQGATYSPSVAYSHSTVWSGWGYIAASVEVPPERLAAFFSDASRIVEDLKAKPVSDDELARARLPRIERIEKARKTNEYWLSELSGASVDPRRLDAIRAAIPGTERVSAADVQAAARRVFANAPFQLMVLPEGSDRR